METTSKRRGRPKESGAGLTAAERKAKSREALKEAMGSRLNIELSLEATEALAIGMAAHGYSRMRGEKKDYIERLLLAEASEREIKVGRRMAETRLCGSCRIYKAVSEMTLSKKPPFGM